jgi:hypothetical protein
MTKQIAIFLKSLTFCFKPVFLCLFIFSLFLSFSPSVFSQVTTPKATTPTKTTTTPGLPNTNAPVQVDAIKSTAGGGFSDCPTFDQIKTTPNLDSKTLLDKCGKQLISFVAIFAIFGLILRISLVGFALVVPGGPNDLSKLKSLISDVVIGVLLIGGFALFLTVINPGVFSINGFGDVAILRTGSNKTVAPATTSNNSNGTNKPLQLTNGNQDTSQDAVISLQKAINNLKNLNVTETEKTEASDKINAFVGQLVECQKPIISQNQIEKCNQINAENTATNNEAQKLVNDNTGNAPILTDNFSSPITNPSLANIQKLRITSISFRDSFDDKSPAINVEFIPKIGEFIKTATWYLEGCQETVLGKATSGQVFENPSQIANSEGCKITVPREETTSQKTSQW